MTKFCFYISLFEIFYVPFCNIGEEQYSATNVCYTKDPSSHLSTN